RGVPRSRWTGWTSPPCCAGYLVTGWLAAAGLDDTRAPDRRWSSGPVGCWHRRIWDREPLVQEYSVPPVVSIDAATNLTDLVWDNADNAPETVQFSRRTPDGWRDVTCAAFRDEVAALAKGLIAAGIQPGDRIAL